jgi:hypothetical protein
VVGPGEVTLSELAGLTDGQRMKSSPRARRRSRPLLVRASVAAASIALLGATAAPALAQDLLAEADPYATPWTPAPNHSPGFVPWTITANDRSLRNGEVLVLKGAQGHAVAVDTDIFLRITAWNGKEWQPIGQLDQSYNPAGFRWTYRFHATSKRTTYYFHAQAIIGDILDFSNVVPVTVLPSRTSTKSAIRR